MKVGRQDSEHPGSSQRRIVSNECLTDPSWATLVSLPPDGMQHLCPYHYITRGEFFIYNRSSDPFSLAPPWLQNNMWLHLLQTPSSPKPELTSDW